MNYNLEKNTSLEVQQKGYFDVLLGWNCKWEWLKNYSDDLDLCAFYRSKNGGTGGVYPNVYNQKNGTEGALTEFPFMFLMGEDRITQKYNNEEIIRIANIHEMEVVYFVAVDYKATIGDENGFNCLVALETIGTEPLVSINYSRNNNEKGHVLILASLKASDSGDLVINNISQLLSLSDAFEIIPGFDSIVTP